MKRRSKKAITTENVSGGIAWDARTNVGKVREHNEDSFLAAPPLFAVADGMGGHAAGEVASAIAVETLSMRAPSSADPVALGKAIEDANVAIMKAAQEGEGRMGMGTTCTAVIIKDDTMAVGHVGDSRAYLLRAGTLIRLTRDHSFVESLVEAGEITADEARFHPNRSFITRALGSDPNLYADNFSVSVEKGDRILLCTDGLCGLLPDIAIEEALLNSPTTSEATESLIDLALNEGGSDNITCVVADIVNDGFQNRLASHRNRAVLGYISVFLLIMLIAVIGGTTYIHNSFYLDDDGGHVTIYQGVDATIFNQPLYERYDKTSVKVSDLPESTQETLSAGYIKFRSLEEAESAVDNYRKQIDDSKTKALETAAAAETAESVTTTEDEG